MPAPSMNWFHNYPQWCPDQLVAARVEGITDTGWGSPVEREVQRRILVTQAAYAYEIANKIIMSDYSFDKLAQTINPRFGTCHPVLDEFFATRFSPMTGMWIHDHPELDRVAALFKRYYTGVVRDACERLAASIARHKAQSTEGRST